MGRIRKKLQLTTKQKNTLKLIQNYLLQQGIIPSYREITKQLKVSSIGTTQRYIDTLVKKGFIKIKPNGHRLIQIIYPPLKNKTLCLAKNKKITIKSPMLIHDIFNVNKTYYDALLYIPFDRNRHVIDEEINEKLNIQPGDWLVIQEKNKYKMNDIVVCYEPYTEKLIVQTYQDIKNMPPDIVVIGKVKGLVRSFVHKRTSSKQENKNKIN